MKRQLVSLLLILVSAPIARAQISGPTGNEEVGVSQRLGHALPLDIRLTNEAGATYPLEHYFASRPVLLQLVYFGCPMLCTQSLNGLHRALKAMPESAGDNFDVLTISFDPREKSALAAEKKRNYLRGYNRPHAETGWHFLTGDTDAIRRLTDALGFHYHWDVHTSSFAHPSMLAVLTPDGRISHYLLGVEFDTGEIHDALKRAAPGRIGSAAPAVFLYCLRYDATRGRYTLIISRAIQLGGLLTFLSLTGFISLNVLKERRGAH